MPIVLDPNEMQTEAGEGWTVVTLANAASIGTPAMVARRWIFQPKALGPEAVHGEADRLLFVVAGSGSAVVDGQRLPLEPESMLWLEPGERYRFEAGDDGLEILEGYAPGERE